MKIVFALFILVGLGLFLAYSFGGIGSFDPAEQAKQLQKDATPGVTWQQLADKYPPKKFIVNFIDDQGFPASGQDVKFDRPAFEKNFTAGEFKLGFSFVYLYDANNQFEVSFDADGKCMSIYKRRTMNDLLNPNPFE